MVAHLLCIQKVRGSSPLVSTKYTMGSLRYVEYLGLPLFYSEWGRKTIRDMKVDVNNRQPYNIETIAAYILKNLEYPYEAMKIQKLCFYTQAWFLASHGEPFFHHDFEAWRPGPVSPSLYKYHFGRIELPDGVLVESGKVQELAEDDAQFIQKTLNVYGRYTGLQLANMCRSQPPWMKTRAAYKNCRQPNKIIPIENIIRYYGSFMERK